MLSTQHLLKQLTIAVVALGEAGRLATDTSYRTINFKSTVRRLNDLKTAILLDHHERVKEAMEALNGPAPQRGPVTDGISIALPPPTEQRVRSRHDGNAAREEATGSINDHTLRGERAQAGMKGGRSRSPAKQKAARANGRRGGRPKGAKPRAPQER